MTRVLLDTHVLLWALTEPSRFRPDTRTLVTDRATTLLVSAASAWEIATKHRLGTLPGADALLLGYRDNLARLGATDLPVTSKHALLAGSLRWDHRDPFDRMLAAQAMTEQIPLVTADSAFARLPGLTVRW